MKLENASGRTDGNSGYIRLFGNNELGSLLSRVQSTIISNGSELERIIASKSNCIEDLDLFVDKVTNGLLNDGVYLCQKGVLKKSVLTIKEIEPDMLIFIVERKRVCKVIELKDGDSFDTKKSKEEKEHLEKFSTEFGAKIPFVTEYYICCFNQNDKNKIYEGFKKRFSFEHIMTGRELCEILSLDYEGIINLRKRDGAENLECFIDELLNIKEVRELIVKKLE